ncbi:MAG: two-component regulator propeller domain-containing protein [Adhaeribacter sp.]
MRLPNRLSFLFFVFLLQVPAARAQQASYSFKRPEMNQGGPTRIQAILEDSRGYLWFGTANGLNRFNGYQFKTFRHDLRDTATIADNSITHLMEGPQGLIWVRTLAGLNMYDPATETFNRRPKAVLRRYGLKDDYVTKILSDGKGSFWFLNSRQGITRFSKKENKLQHFRPGLRSQALPDTSRIADMVLDQGGSLWLVHYNGVLEQMDGRTGKIIYRNKSLKKPSAPVQPQYSLFLDAQGDAWVYVKGSDQGVYYFNRQAAAFRHLHTRSAGLQLNNNIVRSITQDERGVVWIGTDHGGINLVDKKKNLVRYLVHQPEDPGSISQNSIYNLLKDSKGIIWVGTYKMGLNYYHENLVRFPLFQHLAQDAASLPANDINRFVEDAKGNLWIGTNGDGLIYFDRATRRYTRYRQEPGNPNSLSNDVIVGLYLDRSQTLWIGTYFGGLNSFDGHTFRHYRHDPDRPESLADNRVWEIFEDSRGNLWVGTLGGGLDLLDRNTGRFRHHRRGQPHSVHSDYISTITEDRQGNLWVGTAYGVDKRDPETGRFTHFVNNNHNPRGLSNNNVNTVMEDSRGLIWLATNEGLNYYDPGKGSFRSFRREDGLPDNSVVAMVEDEQHHLWLATLEGLSQLVISRQPGSQELAFRFRNYDQSDGLQGKAFNYNAALRTRQGDLLFGGAGGFNRFHPARLPVNTQVPALIFTDFQIFNHPVAVGEQVGDRVLLPRSLNHTREIELQYQENMFSVSFAALNFLQPEKNQYAYILEGFHDNWLAADSRVRKATFTNLDPGTYVFRVRAANNDGVWNKEGISLRIKVLPPWWSTSWARAAYLAAAMLALWLGRRMVQERERLRYRMAQERLEASRRHELDQMKIRFFTNVSHEFRTPLSLILAPVEKLLQQAGAGEGQQQLQLIHRNARRLLSLVNQLLDFRKLEVQGLALHAAPAEVVAFIREIAFSFNDLSEKKHIRFSFFSQVEQLEMDFDQDKLEKILFNLLSNAFKFTREGGQVSVRLDLPGPQQAGSNPACLRIQVQDTGIGIAPEYHQKIFRRFFQSHLPGSMINQGSGIGLAITREFVHLHQGHISLESEPGKGSCFTILLPLRQAPDAKAAPATTPQVPAGLKPDPMPEGTAGGLPERMPEEKMRKKPLVLLVEDNEDFRFYLKDNLQHLYQIHEAPNGKLGWQLALQLLPDLIVSDIMMPEMDGLSLCRKVKQDPRTSRVPVILLTASISEEQKLKGFDTGANDYITKPFNFEILLSRVKNLLVQQALLKKALQVKLQVSPQDIPITPLDEKLIRKALETVERHLANPDFSVEEFSRELGMSRVYLYKKLLALTGQSPLEFIRSIRLKRAARLLEESQLTVAEIAYEVGFNNPKYFTKYFKAEFHCLPSAYTTKKKETEVV